MWKPFFFPVILLILSCTWARAQEIRTNEKGEKIVVYPDGSWRYFNETVIRAPGAYPVAEADISPLDNPVEITEDLARKIANRYSQIAREARLIAEQRAYEAQKQRTRIEHEYAQLTAKGLPAENLYPTRIRLNAAKETELEAQREALLAQQELLEAEAFTAKGNILDLFQKRLEKRTASLDISQVDRLSPDFLSVHDPMEQFYYTSDEARHFTGQECRYDFEGNEKNSGRWRRDNAKQLLFTHTDDRLRLYLKDKEYLRCEGFMTALDGGFRFLTLEFTFAYPNAREAYGFIEKGSILTINLLNGQSLNLRSGTMNQGSYDTETELLTYRVQYPIEPGILNTLKRSEIDSVRVFWSSGYEEYEVYAVDFFFSQITCLGD